MISFNMSWLNLSMRKVEIFRKGRLRLGEKRGGGIGGFGGNGTEGLREWRKRGEIVTMVQGDFGVQVFIPSLESWSTTL